MPVSGNRRDAGSKNYPVADAGRRSSPLAEELVIGGLVAAAFVGVIIMASRSDHEQDRRAHGQKDEGTKPVVVDGNTAGRGVERNEVAADQRYKGKTLEVSGIVRSIRRT